MYIANEQRYDTMQYRRCGKSGLLPRHYLLNTDIRPAELWFTSEGFCQAWLCWPGVTNFDGILINLPGRDPDWMRHVARIENGGRRRPDGVLYQRRTRPVSGRRQRAPCMPRPAAAPTISRKIQEVAPGGSTRRSARPGRAEVSVLSTAWSRTSRIGLGIGPTICSARSSLSRPRWATELSVAQRNLLAVHPVDGAVRLSGERSCT